MSRYVLSPEAQRDLRDIRRYLLDAAGRPVALHVIRGIAAALDLLTARPGIGHFRPDLTDEPVKFWQVFSYLIIYDHIARPIGVARVLHTSRDIAAILETRP